MIRQIVLINGDPSPTSSSVDEALEHLNRRLSTEDYSITSHKLSHKKFSQCVGCWDCWWKTPGICRFKDDAAGLLKDIINSDLVIYCSPMIMGMYSALLKKLHDRTIPLVHPYIEFVKGECHHRKRYPNYPKIGVILERNDASPDEVENTRHLFNRIALNFHSEVKFFYSLQEINTNELSNEINRL